MKMNTLDLGDGSDWFHGAISIQPHRRGLQPWRLPWQELDLYEHFLHIPARRCAGVRLSMVTGAEAIEIDADPIREQLMVEPAGSWSFDLLIDGELHHRQTQPRDDGTVRFDGLPSGKHQLEIYLPHDAAVRVNQVRVGGGAAKPYQDDRPRWVTYGSSITQCGEAQGPSETWPALVANRFGLNLTCMGYGGNCHLEPMVNRLIAQQPADYISLCLGINVMGRCSLNDRTFRAAVLGTIVTIRDAHPDTPMAVVSPIYSKNRETEEGKNAVGLNLPMMREWIAEAVDVLRARGDANLHYVDGLEIMGPDQAKHMPDDLHPDAQGYRVLADRYGRRVMPTLGPSA